MRYKILRAAVDINRETRASVTVREVIDYMHSTGLRQVPTMRSITNHLRGVFDLDDSGGFIIDHQMLILHAPDVKIEVE
jgi:hypothetical protein